MSENALKLFEDKNALATLPDFAREDLGMGTEGIEIRPLRVKVIQAQATEAYEDFDPGDIVLVPQKILLAHKNQPVYIVPVFFYFEWIAVNPLELKSTLKMMIRSRSTDPRSAVAQKAMQPEPERREEPCPEDPRYKIKYKEVRNFVCRVAMNESVGAMPIILSFSGGEWKPGKNFEGLIGMRGKAPIFSNVFEMIVPDKKRSNDKGSWFGIDVENPRSEGHPPPFVQDREEYNSLKAMHLKCKEAYDRDSIVVDHEDDLNHVPVGDDPNAPVF